MNLWGPSYSAVAPGHHYLSRLVVFAVDGLDGLRRSGAVRGLLGGKMVLARVEAVMRLHRAHSLLLLRTCDAAAVRNLKDGAKLPLVQGINSVDLERLQLVSFQSANIYRILGLD